MNCVNQHVSANVVGMLVLAGGASGMVPASELHRQPVLGYLQKRAGNAFHLPVNNTTGVIFFTGR